MDVYERANIRPTRKEQSTQNQTKMCAIIVFDVCFELYVHYTQNLCSVILD